MMRRLLMAMLIRVRGSAMVLARCELHPGPFGKQGLGAAPYRGVAHAQPVACPHGLTIADNNFKHAAVDHIVVGEVEQRAAVGEWW